MSKDPPPAFGAGRVLTIGRIALAVLVLVALPGCLTAVADILETRVVPPCRPRAQRSEIAICSRTSICSCMPPSIPESMIVSRSSLVVV